MDRLHHILKDYSTALKYYEDALKIDEQLGNIQRKVIDLCNIGQVYHSKRLFNTALKIYNRALLIGRKLNLTQNIAFTHWLIALTFLEMDMKSEASLNAKKARNLYNKLNLANDVEKAEIYPVK